MAKDVLFACILEKSLGQELFRISHPELVRPSFPLLDPTVIPRLAFSPQNQTMRIPMIAPIALLRRRPIAKRPVHLGVHVAEDTLGGREEVRPVRMRILAQFPRAVFVVPARDQVGKGGQAGASSEAVASSQLSDPVVLPHICESAWFIQGQNLGYWNKSWEWE